MAGRKLIAGAALVALALVGCSTNPYAQWKDLGAVYCNQVPLPEDAKFDDAVGGKPGEQSEDKTSENMAYWFTTKESADRLVAFYEKAFPGAEKVVDANGETTFWVKPDGGQEGEHVSITVHGDGKIQIGEVTKPGRHQDTGAL